MCSFDLAVTIDDGIKMSYQIFGGGIHLSCLCQEHLSFVIYMHTHTYITHMHKDTHTHSTHTTPNISQHIYTMYRYIHARHGHIAHILSTLNAHI